MKYKYKKDGRRLLHKFSTEMEGGSEIMTIQGTPLRKRSRDSAIQTTLEPLQPQFPHLLLILLMKVHHPCTYKEDRRDKYTTPSSIHVVQMSYTSRR